MNGRSSLLLVIAVVCIVAIVAYVLLTEHGR